MRIRKGDDRCVLGQRGRYNCEGEGKDKKSDYYRDKKALADPDEYRRVGAFIIPEAARWRQLGDLERLQTTRLAALGLRGMQEARIAAATFTWPILCLVQYSSFRRMIRSFRSGLRIRR